MKKTLRQNKEQLIDSPPSKFKYPLKTVVIAIQLVLIGLLSLRGVKRTFSILKPHFPCGNPSHEVIQNWIMRFGLYQLKKLPEIRDDWIFRLIANSCSALRKYLYSATM